MYEIYNFQDGDTLDSISDKYGTSVDNIKSINGFTQEDLLVSGMQIIVPKKDNKFFYYTVKKGDSIYSIADMYNVDSKVIIMLNGLDEDDYIYPNQTLLIPSDGYYIYVTGDNDTLSDVMNKYNVDVSDLMLDNIYLKPEQIIFFKKK